MSSVPVESNANGYFSDCGASFCTASVAVDRVVEIAAPVIENMIDAALPSTQVLKALADEVRRAHTNPKSVAHPELADPDEYWRAAAYPQAASLVRQLRGVLVEVASELSPIVDASRPDFERWLRGAIQADSSNRAVNPEGSLAAVIDQIAGKCGDLHNILAGVGRLVPPSTRLESLRAELASGRRKKVEEAMRTSGDSYEVADAKLRHEPPYRHQDLLLDAHGLAHESLRTDVADMVRSLTEPIFGLGEKMVLAYGEFAAEADAATLQSYDSFVGGSPA